MSSIQTGAVGRAASASESLGTAAQAARSAALDLSLGHIPTSTGESLENVEVQDFGPFRVVFDLSSRVGRVYVDSTAFESRKQRRVAERVFMKLAARIGRETGFSIEGAAHG